MRLADQFGVGLCIIEGKPGGDVFHCNVKVLTLVLIEEADTYEEGKG